MSDEAIGRRERKKAATRKAISDAATRMFLDRGFDAVSIREIADVADVSPTTVFAHFPQKEALVFDEDEAQRELLLRAVRDRHPGTSISQALRALFETGVREAIDEHHGDGPRQFMDLVTATPALSDYAQKMWLRHGDALADAIAAELGLDEPTPQVRAYARFVVQSQSLVFTAPDPAGALGAVFDLLDTGWAAYEADPR
ncbi:TetR/AcrR family transcriptional regulator [Microbacterium phosphatis]|uniref:TetR/AcrR family transcriptional regulator n=1 Tax=Microbacterium phosphatis TaxID=3140248 RepID=UPI0031401B31